MNTIFKFPLKLLSLLYGVAVRWRNQLYDTKFLPVYHSKLPVISIGNITAGGNGKTPLTIFLARELKLRGKSPVILSRGYGGSLRGPKLVEASDQASAVGDEPLMLKLEQSAAVVIAKDRVSGAKFIEAQELGDIIILDDGLQHRRLARDIEIVAVECGNEVAERAFMEAKLLPLGLFREPREMALKRADIVIFTERSLSSEKELKKEVSDLIPRSAQIFRAKLEVQGVFDLSGQRVQTINHAVAFSAIAKPEGFLQTLQSLRLGPVEFFRFSDHHIFSKQEIGRIANRYPASDLICTAKDAIKLRDLPSDLTKRIFVLRTTLSVTPKDTFVVHIMKRILERDTKVANPKVRVLEGR